MIFTKKINNGSDSLSLSLSHENNEYVLHYLVLGRTNTTTAEKAAGIKKKRYIKEDKSYRTHDLKNIDISFIKNAILSEYLREYIENNG